MAKRGIDTPAKDDPTRKKARTAQGADDDSAASAVASENSSPRKQPAPTPIRIAAPSKPSSIRDAASSSVASGASKQRNAAPSASSGMGRASVSMLGSGGSADKSPASAAAGQTKNNAVPPSRPNRKVAEAVPSSNQPLDPKTKDSQKPEPPSKPHNRTNLPITLLALLNVIALSYLLATQSLHNQQQMKFLVDIQTLEDDLSRHRNIMGVLQSGMEAAEDRLKFMEQTEEVKKRAFEKYDGRGVELEEERRVWMEEKRVLSEKREELLEGLNRWLEELDGE